MVDRAGAAGDDAVIGGRRQIDGRVGAAGGDEELEIGKLFEQRARKRCALAHDDDDRESGEASGERVLVPEVVGEDQDVEIARDRGPIGHGEGGILIVVEDRAAHHRFRPVPVARAGGGDHGRKRRR